MFTALEMRKVSLDAEQRCVEANKAFIEEAFIEGKRKVELAASEGKYSCCLAISHPDKCILKAVAEKFHSLQFAVTINNCTLVLNWSSKL